MQHFKFENWRIGEFDFWCHEQVISNTLSISTYLHLALAWHLKYLISLGKWSEIENNYSNYYSFENNEKIFYLVGRNWISY